MNYIINEDEGYTVEEIYSEIAPEIIEKSKLYRKVLYYIYCVYRRNRLNPTVELLKRLKKTDLIELLSIVRENKNKENKFILNKIKTYLLNMEYNDKNKNAINEFMKQEL